MAYRAAARVGQAKVHKVAGSINRVLDLPDLARDQDTGFADPGPGGLPGLQSRGDEGSEECFHKRLQDMGGEGKAEAPFCCRFGTRCWRPNCVFAHEAEA